MTCHSLLALRMSPQRVEKEYRDPGKEVLQFRL